MVLKNKKALVVGLRRTGVAAAKFLVREGASVAVTDKGDPASFVEERKALAGMEVKFILGSHSLDDFTSTELLVVSPGVPLYIREIETARRAGVEVIGEMELAARYMEAPILAISGTNGKSTATSLAGEMLEKAGKKVFVGGNIGNPLLNLVISGQKVDVAVVEVSSFQLEGIVSFKPKVAVMLNITPDHLDRYPSMEKYIEAKARMFINQSEGDWAVVNADDPLVMNSVDKAKSAQVRFSTKGAPDFPARAWVEGHEMVLETQKGRTEKLSIEKMKLEGAHNRENAVAAAAAVRLMNVSVSDIQRALEAFEGLPHRVQFVRELDGVRYFDDSKGTNVGAVEKSLAGFDSPVVLIAGGLDKGSDFTPLNPLLKKHARALVLMGAAKQKMMRQIGSAVKTVTASDMKDAVEQARTLAERGDVVLLSPACASFDMFRDYGHRGDVFRRAVEELEK